MFNKDLIVYYKPGDEPDEELDAVFRLVASIQSVDLKYKQGSSNRIVYGSTEVDQDFVDYHAANIYDSMAMHNGKDKRQAYVHALIGAINDPEQLTNGFVAIQNVYDPMELAFIRGQTNKPVVIADRYMHADLVKSIGLEFGKNLQIVKVYNNEPVDVWSFGQVDLDEFLMN
jgi:hypothetical protein